MSYYSPARPSGELVMLRLERGRFSVDGNDGERAREKGCGVDDAPRIVGLDGKRSGWLEGTSWVGPGGKEGKMAGVGVEKERCGSMTGPDFS